MGAKRTAKKTTPKKKPSTPKKPASRNPTVRKGAPPAKKAATKKAAPKKTTTKKTTTRKPARPLSRERSTPTRALSPEDLAARIAATGLVASAYLLPWESIHGQSDYVSIVTALRDLAHGDFPVEDVKSAVDFDRGEGSLELSLGGVRHLLDVVVQGPELDEGALVMLTALFDRHQDKRPPAERRRFYIDPSTCRRAHTHLLVCATDDAAAALNAATGAAFIRVSEL